MTNTELLAKIKAEIERRIKFHTDAIKSCTGLNTISLTHSGGLKEDEYLLSFLSTLESEKPIEGLEEEIETYFDGNFGIPWDGCHPIGVFELDSMARHFAKWGSEDAREQIMKEAVEGEIFDDYDKDTCEHHLTILSTVPSGYKDGDKVRIIVLPKED